MNQGSSSSPPPPPPPQSATQHHHRRHGLVERCSTLRACDPCKRKKRVCNGQRPCSHCIHDEDGGKKEIKSCVYSVVPDHARGVFTTSTARRLSSGSACETCRRRKTKCDGASPCGYCAANQLECINLQTSRKRSLANIANKPFVNTSQSSPTANAASHLTTTTSTTATPTTYPPLYSSPLSHHTAGGVSPTTTTTTTTTIAMQRTADNNDQTMDRIEDRLQRIEKLMVAFSDNTTTTHNNNSQSSVYRKLSTPPHSFHATSAAPTYIRPHRHSVQGISVAKEQVELRTALAMSRTRVHEAKPQSPPPLASSMLNLTLSPSSSTSSSATPTTTGLDDLLFTSEPRMPSCMDQLSKRTFNHAAMDYGTVHYPIYPLSLPSPQ